MLILASQSASRRAMLEAAGVPFMALPAALDERAIEARMAGQPAAEVALALARAKALAVGAQHPDRLVLGSDSLVVCAGRRFDKPRDRAEAAEHLQQAVTSDPKFADAWLNLAKARYDAKDKKVRGNRVEWDHAALARLRVTTLSESFIAAYLEHEWPAVAGCVGVFRIEGRGVQLFEAIEGDHFTVLGMPLLAVQGALRARGMLPQ